MSDFVKFSVNDILLDCGLVPAFCRSEDSKSAIERSFRLGYVYSIGVSSAFFLNGHKLQGSSYEFIRFSKQSLINYVVNLRTKNSERFALKNDSEVTLNIYVSIQKRAVNLDYLACKLPDNSLDDVSFTALPYGEECRFYKTKEVCLQSLGLVAPTMPQTLFTEPYYTSEVEEDITKIWSSQNIGSKYEDYELDKFIDTNVTPLFNQRAQISNFVDTKDDNRI